MNANTLFQHRPPQIGSKEYSAWHEVPDCTVPFPWAHELSATGTTKFESLSAAWISVVGEPLTVDEEFNTYRQRFGWVTPEPVNADIEPAAVVLRNTASKLLEFARKNTFKKFGRATLGITLESTLSCWSGASYEDPNHLDALLHLDWTVREPCLLALGSSAQPSILLNGPYNYKGDLANNGKTISYSLDDGDFKPLDSKAGKVYVSDSRRGVHSRPLMPKGFTPFPRVYLRSFIAARP